MYNILHIVFFVTVFLASLVGSLRGLGRHADSEVVPGIQKSAMIAGQLQYHLGRGILYILLGFIATYFGESLISYFSNDSAEYLAPLSILAVFLLVYTLYGKHPGAWLYTFVLLAAGSGSEVDGVMVMLAFWLGTLPAVLVADTISDKVVSALKKYTLIPLFLMVLAAVISVTLRIAPSLHSYEEALAIGSDGMVLPEKCVH